MRHTRGRARVPLVDDYTDAREISTEDLEFAEFAVVEAANGVKATRRLKADERRAAISVVALTGQALASIAAGAKKAGFAAFVTKPCLRRILFARSARASTLDRRFSETAARKKNT